MADVEVPVEQWGHFAVRTWRQKLTYRAYIPPRLEPLTRGLSLSLAQLLAEAERSLRDLQAHRGAGDRNEDHLAALGHQLLRAESVASSRIEGSRVSHRGLARALYNSGTTTRSTRSVVGNVRAMESAIQIGASNIEFRLENLQAMHTALLQAGDAPGSPGDVRVRQTWIGGSEIWPHQAEYVPPPPDVLPDLLEDLCGFLNRTDLPGLLQAALVHAQFEAIHPFGAGNGRVGRCLTQVVLRRRGLTPRLPPPLSVVLGNNVPAYLDGLRGYRAGRIEDWCGLFARSTSIAAAGAVDLANRFDELREAWRDRAGRPRRNSAAARLLAVLTLRPIVDGPAAQRLLGVSDEAARLALLNLEQRGVLKRIGSGRYRRVWSAEDVFT
ncbi:MAG: Fic family protein, partial [Candidatus Dormibacteraeota bacterium]|nr:Fic family protein [Candidatus Dormibacteraeota bacterium]